MDSYALQNRQRRIKIKTLDHFLQAAEIIGKRRFQDFLIFRQKIHRCGIAVLQQIHQCGTDKRLFRLRRIERSLREALINSPSS